MPGVANERGRALPGACPPPGHTCSPAADPEGSSGRPTTASAPAYSPGLRRRARELPEEHPAAPETPAPAPRQFPATAPLLSAERGTGGPCGSRQKPGRPLPSTAEGRLSGAGLLRGSGWREKGPSPSPAEAPRRQDVREALRAVAHTVGGMALPAAQNCPGKGRRGEGVASPRSGEERSAHAAQGAPMRESRAATAPRAKAGVSRHLGGDPGDGQGTPGTGRAPRGSPRELHSRQFPGRRVSGAVGSAGGQPRSTLSSAAAVREKSGNTPSARRGMFAPEEALFFKGCLGILF